MQHYRRFHCVTAALVVCACVAPLHAQDAETGKSKLPRPDHANIAYGPHARNVMDVWRAKSDGPAPLLVYFHGGGFAAGSKENLPAALLAAALRAGISVAAANYRLSPEVVFPARRREAHAARSVRVPESRLAVRRRRSDRRVAHGLERAEFPQRQSPHVSPREKLSRPRPMNLPRFRP